MLRWLGSVIFLFILYMAGSYAYEYWTHIRHEKNLALIVKTQSEVPCTEKDGGVYVGYRNNSTATIKYIVIDFWATEVGHSNNVIEDGMVTFDYVTAPGQDYAKCVYFDFKREYRNRSLTLGPLNGKIIRTAFQ